jgi:hypothetical protein
VMLAGVRLTEPTPAAVEALGDVHTPPPGAEAVVKISPPGFLASLFADAVPGVTAAPPVAEAFAWIFPLRVAPIAVALETAAPPEPPPPRQLPKPSRQPRRRSPDSPDEVAVAFPPTAPAWGEPPP